MSHRPPLPKLAPKPGMVKTFRALYSYTSIQPDELSFEEGDIIFVTDKGHQDWWKATCKGKTGLIPSNYVSQDGKSAIDYPLQEAAKRGNLSFLRESIEERIGINTRDKSGGTALYWAAHSGHGACAEELLKNSLVDLNAQNKLGDTALHAAAWKGHDEIIELLLQRGANASIKNKDNKLAYDLASDPTCASLLKLTGQNSVATTNNQEYLGEGDDSD